MSAVQGWMVYAVLIAVAFGAGTGAGWSVCDARWAQQDTDRKLSEATSANSAWAERFTLASQLATRDQQLATSQSLAAQNRTVVVVKKEIIYRDKIKDVVVRDCVANSGLLDVYDATLELSSAAE